MKNIHELRIEVKTLSLQIRELEDEREQLIQENKESIIMAICHIMDWNRRDITDNHMSFNKLYSRIAVEIRNRIDPNARYVFMVGNKNIELQFREEA